MESCDSGVTSPILRVTAEITEIKEKNEGNRNHIYSASPSLVNKETKNHSVNTKKKLKPLYGYNPYERSNCGGSYVSTQPKNNVSSFTQRVMSAKLLRMKQLQNQLYETQAKLNEALQENRTLKTLQQRQDSVLKKYEGNQEQFPQLMKSHHEEIRVLNEKYKQLRSNHRELENRFKQKDNELSILRDQHKHLLKLSKDKNLGEREKLAKKIEEMQLTIDEQRKKLFTLTKKLDLEEKNYNHQLSQETMKNKKIQNELSTTKETINNLRATIEAKERLSAVSFRRPIQSSAKNPMVPLRVSIRQQPPEKNHSNNAAEEHEDSETSDDSFTMNYSPIARRNSSSESDASDSSKDNSKPANILGSENILNSRLKNGLKINKNPTVNRGILKQTVKKDEPIRKSEESKVRRKLLAQRSLQKDSVTMRASRKSSLDKLFRNINKNKEYKNDTSISGKNKNIPNHEEEMMNENQTLSNENSKVNDDNNIDSGISSDIKLDLDSEFEKFFQNTQLSDEAINEFYQRDFKEEIFELERKFQELNDHNNEKLEMMKSAKNYTQSTSTVDSEVEEMHSTLENSNDLAIFENKHTVPMLEEYQKANLLKALNSIDDTTNKNKVDERIVLPHIKPGSPGLHTNSSHTSKEVKKGYQQTRRKSQVLKDIFGTDTTVLKS